MSEKRDPADLERTASEIRADMDRTLDALERKFSPGQLLDRSLGYLQTHGGDLTRTIGDTVKQNPVPIFLTAAGLTWLLASALSSRARTEDLYALEDDLDEDEDEDEYDLSEEVEESASGLRSRVRDRFQDRVAATRERLRASRARAANKVSQVVDTTRERSAHVRGRATELMEDNPLVFGAIAVAVGALIGAALPTTQVENRTVGQVRDRALEKARQASQRQYENLRSKLAPEETEVTRSRTEH